MTGIQISPLRPLERAPLFGLAESVFAGFSGWSRDRVVAALDDDVVFVAREGGGLAGYVALRRENERSLLIEQLLVAPAHERRGVGRALLAYAEGFAVSERAVALRIVVEAANRPACDLYRRLGFVPAEPEIFERSLPYVL